METTQNGYTIKFVNGGVEYFAPQGQPITNAQFASATGMDTNNIEFAASNNYSSYGQYVVDQGGQDPFSGAQDPGQQQAIQNTGDPFGDASPTQTQTQTSGGGTAPETFQPISYNGKIYYTAEDYANAVTEKITGDYNDSVKKIENNFKNGFITIDERDAEIKRTRTALVKKKGDDLQSISGYMNSISPDALQSGRGKLEGEAVKSYTESNKSLGSALGANLYDSSGRIKQNLNTADLAPYMTQLSDTGNLARAISGNYQNKDTNMAAANAAFNSGQEQNANNYIGNQPSTASPSSYTDYLNSSILNTQKSPTQGVGGFASTAKTDKYGNPIDEYLNR